MRNQPCSISAPGLALETELWFACFLLHAEFIKIKLQEFCHSNTSHALQRSSKHSGNSFTHWGCSNLMNTGGSLQICRVVHPPTPDPASSLCAPLPDSSVPPAIPNSIPTRMQGLSTLWTHPRFVHCYSTLEYLLPSVLPVFISLLSAQAISHVDTLHSAGQKWSGIALLGHVGGCQIFSHRQRCLELWLL